MVYGLTLVLFCGIWWYDARFLNWAFDLNLALIKRAASVFDGSGKSEAMLRAFSAEKMLLFGEGSAVIWGIAKLATKGVRRLFKGPRIAADRPAGVVQQPVTEFRSRFGSR